LSTGGCPSANAGAAGPNTNNVAATIAMNLLIITFFDIWMKFVLLI